MLDKQRRELPNSIFAVPLRFLVFFTLMMTMPLASYRSESSLARLVLLAFTATVGVAYSLIINRSGSFLPRGALIGSMFLGVLLYGIAAMLIVDLLTASAWQSNAFLCVPLVSAALVGTILMFQAIV